MLEVLAIVLMAAAGIGAAAAAINFFWCTGWKKSLQWAGLFIGVALLFGLSGIWQGSSRHSWGIWTPIFALMLACAWLGIKYGHKIWQYWRQKEKEARDK